MFIQEKERKIAVILPAKQILLSVLFYLLQHPEFNLLSLLVLGGKSTDGLPAKKPSGLRVKPVISQGMTGKSSKNR